MNDIQIEHLTGTLNLDLIQKKIMHAYNNYLSDPKRELYTHFLLSNMNYKHIMLYLSRRET